LINPTFEPEDTFLFSFTSDVATVRRTPPQPLVRWTDERADATHFTDLQSFALAVKGLYFGEARMVRVRKRLDED